MKRSRSLLKFLLITSIFLVSYALLFLCMGWTKSYSWVLLIVVSLCNAILIYRKGLKEDKEREET